MAAARPSPISIRRGFDSHLLWSHFQWDRSLVEPNANARAERVVGTVRAERLDWTVVRGRRHLERVLCEYVAHYNEHRPIERPDCILSLIGQTDHDCENMNE